MMPLADMTPKQVMERLGLPRSTFWREMDKGIKAGTVKAVKWGRTYRFDASSIERLRASRLIASPEDARRLADGRRKS